MELMDILIKMLVLLGIHFSRYLGMTMFSFQKHVLTTLFCAITMILYLLAIFNDKKIKIEINTYKIKKK